LPWLPIVSYGNWPPPPPPPPSSPSVSFTSHKSSETAAQQHMQQTLNRTGHVNISPPKNKNKTKVTRDFHICIYLFVSSTKDMRLRNGMGSTVQRQGLKGLGSWTPW
jgi:hypothetical protein